jgi:hypothetical protein
MNIRDMNKIALPRMDPQIGLPRSRKGAWLRGRLDVTGGDRCTMGMFAGAAAL